ncbi:MAG: hypothetical protein AB7E49_09195 [Campylobacterales bacterium]
MTNKTGWLVLLSAWAALSLEAAWYDKMTVNGYFSHEYEKRLSGDTCDKPGCPDPNGSFDADMFDLVFNFQPTDRLRIAADLTWEHGVQSEIAKGNIASEYTFAEYTVSDLLRIRAGKMFTPFGIYNEIHTAKPAFVIMKEPNPTNKMYFIEKGDEGLYFYPRWGSGIAAVGNGFAGSMPFDYAVMIANGDREYDGSGDHGNEYDKDDNPQKGYTARLRLNPTDDWQVGASLYRDRLNNYDANDDLNGTGELMSLGLQSMWHITDRIGLELEFMTGYYDRDQKERIDRYGFSILPTWLVDGDRVTLYFLYAEADPNLDKSNNKVRIYQPGVNIEIDDNLFLKLELYNVRAERNNALLSGAEYTEFRSAIAIGF